MMDWDAEEDMAKDVEENPEIYQALADKPDNTMTLETDYFVDAAQNNSYAEYGLEGGSFVLVTNWEDDGEFRPIMVLPEGFDDEGKATNLLDEEAGHFMDFEGVEIEEQNHLTFAYIRGGEITVE